MNDFRTIKPNEPADFTPTLGDYKTLQPFRYWCQKVLPLVYDDSLSYYELLCKVIDYLNKTMSDVETLHGDVTNLHKAYEELQGYINDYFSSLDVQEEINNKLNQMASDGTLLAIISPTISSETANWLANNITTTSPVIDKTLTISEAGADAKVVGERLLKDGVSYSYQYLSGISYRGDGDVSSYDLNGTSFLDTEYYNKAKLGTNTSLLAVNGTLFESIKNPNTATMDVYCIMDLRNQNQIGTMSLWLSDATANWNTNHVCYGGYIGVEYGAIKIYKFTLNKGGSSQNISDIILRIDNVGSVPENYNFKFALLTDSTLYDLLKTEKTLIDDTLTISGEGADAKVVGERLLKDGISYSYQYSSGISYRGDSNGAVYNLNGTSFLDTTHYNNATLGTNRSLLGVIGTLFEGIKNPNTDTMNVYCVMDLRNQSENSTLSLWLSDTSASWNNEHVCYGGGISVDFGTINIYKFTLNKGGSSSDIANVILRIDNTSAVPENYNFKFALLTDSMLYDLLTNFNDNTRYNTDICFWGDSLTQGAGGNGVTYPSVCANELGITRYKNCGVGGEIANTVSCRQGGNTLVLPTGAVNRYTLSQMKDVYGYDCHPLRQGGNDTVNPITINGVECTLAISQTSPTDSNAYYTITGYTDVLKSETPVKFSGCDIFAKINVIFVGQNGPDLDTRISVIDSMISKCEERYIVLGLSSGTKTEREAEESKLLYKYGVHFFNTRALLSKYGCAVAGVTPSASDLEEINNGKVPQILRSDNVHLNSNGYTALGKLLAQKIRANGYV